MPTTPKFWSREITVPFVEMTLGNHALIPDSRIFGKNNNAKGERSFYTKYYFKNPVTGKECCFIHYIDSHLVSFTFQSNVKDTISIEHTSKRKRFVELIGQIQKLVKT